VSRRACLDDVEKRKFLTLPGRYTDCANPVPICNHGKCKTSAKSEPAELLQGEPLPWPDFRWKDQNTVDRFYSDICFSKITKLGCNLNYYKKLERKKLPWNEFLVSDGGPNYCKLLGLPGNLTVGKCLRSTPNLATTQHPIQTFPTYQFICLMAPCQ
jgi:hypothetical protein